MSITSANAERVDADALSSIGWPLCWLGRDDQACLFKGNCQYVRAPRSALDARGKVKYGFCLALRTGWIGLAELDLGRNNAFLEGQDSLDKAGEARRSLGVADVRFDLGTWGENT